MNVTKYVVCQSCKIGGYDFCPKCAGGGGYSIVVNTIDINPLIKFDSSLLAKLNRQLSLIKERNEQISPKIENHLKESFVELSKMEYNEHVAAMLETIISMRKTEFYRRKRNQIKKNLENFGLDQIEFIINENTIELRRKKYRNDSDVILAFASHKEIFQVRAESICYLSKNGAVKNFFDIDSFLTFLTKIKDNAILNISENEYFVKGNSESECIKNINFNTALAIEIFFPEKHMSFIVDVNQLPE